MTILDSETKAAEHSDDHGDELRLWLRLLTCTTLIEGEVRGGEHGARGGGVGAQQIDDRAAGVGGDTVFLDGGAKIVGGEAILGIE